MSNCVSNGDAVAAQNDGEFLFHAGVTLAPTVETFTVRWTLFNPGDALWHGSQQISGYVGTGNQSDISKIVATRDGRGEIETSIDNADIPTTTLPQVDDLFNVSEADGKRIIIELEVDPNAAFAIPTIAYETAVGESTVVGNSLSLSGTAVLEAIRGETTVKA